MVRTFVIYSILIFTSALNAFAHDWQKIAIPGAVCGDGKPYSVFVYKQSDKKLLVEFMGGGACWNQLTCFGVTNSWTLPEADQPEASVPTSDSSDNPFREFSMLYFPYCTGDVHAGNHIEEYVPGVQAHHVGYSNVLKTLAYLSDNHILEFSNYQDVMLWGASAGAIGALAHVKNIDHYLNPNAHKVLFADSPGLHFGKNFWHKFDSDMMKDFHSSFGKVNVAIDDNDGFIAKNFGPFFAALSNWQIGIIQSSDDIVMSVVFGDENPVEESFKIFSSHGISKIAAPYPNVKTWIPYSVMHTYLSLEASAFMPVASDSPYTNAMDFTQNYADYLNQN